MPLLRLITGYLREFQWKVAKEKPTNSEVLSWLKVSMYQKNSHQKIFGEREKIIINVDPHQKSPLKREYCCDRLLILYYEGNGG